ncbi:methionine--tRNA ligase [Moraxella catarrhalis]|uniref:methionine--tRNA ligase n=1 Tax=Moraxella catarrhalis TaxID=480 RepID=UPI000802FCEE|nr:methionine--tRNA ligase [Moraxella catarrhalis]AZQ87311.1 methionine--tRNA ligase, beta subunit [Moraxella catarrhalis]AZQ91010.1 methionine--tRNA ligase [Moraxella catarrhalis]OBX78051.1 methionine--tRNA ligase [Moraxella catarrhalis]
MTTSRKILVTSALPYANGPIHLGHLVEYIQTDIWVRAMKAMGHNVTYVCADDAHGTAIMLKAQDNGITPEEQIATVKASHEKDFAGFLIDFDNYHSTHSSENQYFSQKIYTTLKQNGYIFTKDVEQLFDTEKGLFLADRFVKGTCPECDAPNQYGDNCEVCSSTYNATELKNPYSTLSNSSPIIRSSKHYFFNLPQFDEFLRTWTKSQGRLQSSIYNKLSEWFDAGLAPWDISRDAPYFGFKIPDTPADEPDKYFYVWLDAPVGYMASFKNLCDRTDMDFDEYFNKDSQTELYHFIGKDIVYFHSLFWPAMLEGAGYRTPTAVNAHGFLTVNGEKMSKSRGTFIKAETYLTHLDPEYLRYYFASKLSANVEDINLDLEDFMQKVNSDLVGKVVNIASRSAGFIHKNHDGKLSDELTEPKLIDEIICAGDEIAAAYEAREFAKVTRLIMACADKANEYIDTQKPWALNKAGKFDEVQKVCTVSLNIFHKLIIYLAPILPKLSEQAREFLNIDSLEFDTRHRHLLSHHINLFTPLMQRIDKDKVNAMIHDSKENLTQTSGTDNTKKTVLDDTDTAKSAYIGIDEFAKVTMKVAHVVKCQSVEGADKLLQFTLDVGEEHTRNVFSGIAKFYQPEELTDKKVICVTNLAPRKMKFGISEGMILSAEKQGVLTVITLPDTMPIGAVLA